MRRDCTGRRTWPASKKTSSPTTTRPRSGVSRPAMALRTLVLPEPEAPNSAVTPASLSKRVASVKLPRRAPMSTDSRIGASALEAAPRRPQQPLGQDERAEREQDRQDAQPPGLRVAPRHLCQAVD